MQGQKKKERASRMCIIGVIGTMYPISFPYPVLIYINVVSILQGHPRSSLGANLGVRMSTQPTGTSQPCPVYGQ